MTTHVLPTYFISHGGGPWPWMLEQMAGAYDALAASLRAMPAQLGGTPRAVLVVSAHWEEDEFTIQSAASPPMIYDYSGFPPHTYAIRYPAPGAPPLAARVAQLLRDAGIAAVLDAQRGFDHGCYVPLAVIYPRADMPLLQLSLKRGLDPAGHIAVGRALSALRSEGVLIVGSGLSYHNLRAFGPAARKPSAAFDAWLQQTLLALGPAQRSARLLAWEHAPAARLAHPREEHLMPLMVAVGAAEDAAGACVYHQDDFLGGVTASSFCFGAG